MFNLTDTNYFDLSICGEGGNLIVKDNRLLTLFVEQILLTFPNCVKVRNSLEIDGCRVLLRSFNAEHKANCIPSYQKGHGRQFTEEGFEDTLRNTDFYLFLHLDGLEVEVIPMLASSLINTKEITYGEVLNYANKAA